MVENFIELTSEVVEIGRASLGSGCAINQLSGGEIIKSKNRFQDDVKLSSPCLRHFTTDRRYSDKQCCDRQAAILVCQSPL